ncbi:hypothetical protein [Galbitalea soli]|uniref:Uncharacterized protein n=1 Tax=Galbitalea soli TaxID=1268042 RepID=A0A7C9TRJ5_9MICO|nr:hypothetical protein [Galbitalea soli]NEM91344.1 hypothetical protein [Galbitalea soli]NYJ30034.1 hypothetical protein [Galbitalea soli]
MTDPGARDDELERWLQTVDRTTRRHGAVDRTLRDDRSGPLTIPIRFAFKVLEVGPSRALSLGMGVVAAKLGRR